MLRPHRSRQDDERVDPVRPCGPAELEAGHVGRARFGGGEYGRTRWRVCRVGAVRAVLASGAPRAPHFLGPVGQSDITWYPRMTDQWRPPLVDPRSHCKDFPTKLIAYYWRGTVHRAARLN